MGTSPLLVYKENEIRKHNDELIQCLKKNIAFITYIRARWRRSCVDKCSTCAISATKSECSMTHRLDEL